MKTVKLLLTILALSLLLSGCRKREAQPQNGGRGAETQAQTQAKADIGQKAPAFTLQSCDGNTVSLSDYAGKVLVIEWFNYDCPFSRYSYETAHALKDLKAKYADKGVAVLSINSTASAKPEKTKQIAQAHNLDYPILDDRPGLVGRAYGALTTPHIFIIDQQGNIAYNGALDNAPLGKPDSGQLINYTENALQQLLAGEQISTPKTKPYGCSVKYAQ